LAPLCAISAPQRGIHDGDVVMADGAWLSKVKGCP
jgi:hypothetical protein